MCNAAATELLFEARGFDSSDETFEIVVCPTCEVALTQPFLSPDELERYYRADYYGGGNQAKPSTQKFLPTIEWLVQLGNRRRATAFSRLLPDGGGSPANVCVLDVGCGRGGFLRALAARGYDCTGIDIAPFEADFTGSVKFQRGSLEAQEFPPQSFDAVRIWHVLEHLHDPLRTLQECRRVLKPHGVLVLAVPNFGSWQAARFGRAWFHLDLPRHLYHFSPRSLGKLLQATGFDLANQRTLSWEQNIYGWVQSLQNSLNPRSPNRLYRLLKNPGALRMAAALDLRAPALAALALCSLPPAIAETLASSLVGRGATLIVKARCMS